MLALITGASSGMGRDMARILSKMGYDLILVARRRERLLELKKELDTNVTVISMDLSIVQNNYKLYEKVKNKNIDILINNAGFMAGPRMATYYATKNYITKLTMAIHEELRHKNSKVTISALCPGPVDTEFNKVAQGGFKVNGVSSEYVAKYGIDKMFQQKLIIVPTLSMKLGLFFSRFLPWSLLLKITYQIEYRKEKKNR